MGHHYLFRRRMFYLVFLMIVSFFLSGFVLQQNTTEQGLYFISLELEESHMKVGKNSMKIFVGDRRSKAPVKDKLDIEVVPWMPSHEHGTSEMAVIRELGKGFYLIEGVNLTMTGDWEIYVRINQGRRGEDTAVFNVRAVK
jgi:hypothetical protein